MIAAAALIMISVFSSFILNGDPVVKQFGVGLSSAVFLAATMVLMLAPAVLILLGKWAWWMPRWLGQDRAHDRHRGHRPDRARAGAAAADVRRAGRGACGMMAAWPRSIPSRPPSGSAS